MAQSQRSGCRKYIFKMLQETSLCVLRAELLMISLADRDYTVAQQAESHQVQLSLVNAIVFIETNYFPAHASFWIAAF